MKPKKKIDVRQVEELAEKGLVRREIAAALGVSERTLYDRQKESAEIAGAYERGRARGVSFVSYKLWELIEAGNLRAIMFYLKCRAGWTEDGETEDSGEGTSRIEFHVIRPANRSVTD